VESCDKLRLGLVSLGGLGGVCHGEMRLGKAVVVWCVVVRAGALG